MMIIIAIWIDLPIKGAETNASETNAALGCCVPISVSHGSIGET